LFNYLHMSKIMFIFAVNNKDKELWNQIKTNNYVYVSC